MFLTENLLAPDAYVDAGDCNRNRGASTGEEENRVRKPRALEKVEEEEEEEEEGGERGKMWGS